MQHGALPYVDLWDRKPVGLFLIYAAIGLLGGDGIVEYQIVATCFAAATAFMIARLARRIAPGRGGLWAGAIYLIFVMINGGQGGQAPVFYNLIVACAAWAVVRAIEQQRFDRRAFGFACAAMALLGIAMQVKYSVVFEGVYFGVALILLAWRGGLGPARLAAAGAAWAGLALAPTGLALGWFAALGHERDFLFQNFESIFRRGGLPGAVLVGRVFKIVIHILPMGAVAAAGCWWRSVPAEQNREIRRFFTGWAVVAVVSVAAFGTYHDHYALPLLLPFAVAGAPAYAWLWPLPGRREVRIAPVAVSTALVGLVAAAFIVPDVARQRGAAAGTRAMVAAIGPAHPGCLFVFSGDPILYHLTGSCLPTRYNFPTLLSEGRDMASLGTDAHGELARVMATRPQFVVTRDGYPFPEADPAAWDFMRGVLARDYRLVFSQPAGTHRQLLYRLREESGAPAKAAD